LKARAHTVGARHHLTCCDSDGLLISDIEEQGSEAAPELSREDFGILLLSHGSINVILSLIVAIQHDPDQGESNPRADAGYHNSPRLSVVQHHEAANQTWNKRAVSEHGH
jgi:hypothetical protein